MNLAVGGVTGFFPDGVDGNPSKPWTNGDSDAGGSFWNGVSVPNNNQLKLSA